jgi:hypothetical protein
MRSILPKAALTLGLTIFTPQLITANAVAQNGPNAGQLKVLYTEHPGVPQNEVPGLPGATFYQFGGINEIRVSPAGDIAVRAVISLNGQFLDALIVNDRVVLKEGDPLPWATSESLFLIRDFAVNDSGSIVISFDSTGPNGGNSYCVREDSPGSWTVIAQKGNPIPDFPGKNYGIQYGATIDQSGQVGFMSHGVSSGFNNDEALEFNQLILARSGLDAPSGQLSGLNETYSSFEGSGTPRVNSDGSQWLAQAFLDGSNNEVLVVNGAVALQAGYQIPGSNYALAVAPNGVKFATFDRAGNWYAHGYFNPGNEYWAVSNGAILTRTGLPIFSGSGEVWLRNRNFPLVAGNGTDFVVVGTSATSFLAHMVRNNTEIICSQLDPIDLDDNGQFDDELLLQGFSEGFMTDDGSVAFFGMTRSTKAGGGTENSILIYDNTPDPKLTITGLVAGSTATVEVAPVAVGSTVYSAYSLAGGGPTSLNTPWGLLSVELSQPFTTLPNMVGDATGTATQQIPIPLQALGMSVWIQAIEDEGGGIAQLSNGFVGVVQ